MTSTGWKFLLGSLFFLSILLREPTLLLLDLLLVLAALTSALWKRYGLARVTYRRRLGSKRLFFGDETTLDVEITNGKLLPLPWLKAEDHFPRALDFLRGHLELSTSPHRGILRNSLSLRWYERVTRRYRLRAAHRGIYELGPVSLQVGDLFGLRRQRQTLDETEELIVYPRILPLAELGLPAEFPFGEEKPIRRVVEDPLRLRGAREYRSSDSMRHIHWKATAHTGQLQTKEYEPGASRYLVVFLNASTAEYIYEGLNPPLLEFLITVAASVATAAIEEECQVGLYVNEWGMGDLYMHIPPSGRSDQLMLILEMLAQDIFWGHVPLTGLLSQELSKLPYGSTVVVISALADEDLFSALLDVKATGRRVTLLTVGEKPFPIQVDEFPVYHVNPPASREEDREIERLELAQR
ncbi:MAG: DUF58 domain-containing protein [Chloroflexota bacterium]|nr:DUF58 domain-containing protein [Chloroflexota bacterium]